MSSTTAALAVEGFPLDEGLQVALLCEILTWTRKSPGSERRDRWMPDSTW